MKKKAQVAAVQLPPADQWSGISEAMKPLDRLAREMELKWGAGRLPALVEPELASLFGKAKDKLNEAIQCNDPDVIVRRVQVMIRGWEKLDAVASAAEMETLPARTLGYSHNGRAYVVVLEPQDYDIARHAAEEGATVVALAELLEAYKIIEGRVGSVLQAFPGAQIREVKTPRISFEGDEIPF